jgi:hypothetical protein
MITYYIVWDNDWDNEPLLFTSAAQALDFYLEDRIDRRINKVVVRV